MREEMLINVLTINVDPKNVFLFRLLNDEPIK